MAKKKKKADEKPKKKAAKSRVDDEDDLDEEEYSPSEATKPRLDIYVGLSSITMLLLIAAGVFFYMDAEAGKAKTPPQVALTIGGLQGGGRPAPGPAPVPAPQQPGN